MNNPNGCTGLNCQLQHDKVRRCELKECPWRIGETAEDVVPKVFRSAILMCEGLCNEKPRDMVDVVRCKDCAFSSIITAADPRYPLRCRRWDAPRQVWANDYCSYGRRKEKRGDDIYHKDG